MSVLIVPFIPVLASVALIGVVSTVRKLKGIGKK